VTEVVIRVPQYQPGDTDNVAMNPVIAAQHAAAAVPRTVGVEDGAPVTIPETQVLTPAVESWTQIKGRRMASDGSLLPRKTR
jgi:hypothetical protein